MLKGVGCILNRPKSEIFVLCTISIPYAVKATNFAKYHVACVRGSPDLTMSYVDSV